MEPIITNAAAVAQHAGGFVISSGEIGAVIGAAITIVGALGAAVIFLVRQGHALGLAAGHEEALMKSIVALELAVKDAAVKAEARDRDISAWRAIADMLNARITVIEEDRKLAKVEYSRWIEGIETQVEVAHGAVQLMQVQVGEIGRLEARFDKRFDKLEETISDFVNRSKA